MSLRPRLSTIPAVLFLLAAMAAAAPPAAAQSPNDPGILTPPPPHEPRINGPSVYGTRPGRPFLYRIPATGDRPMRFEVRGLPAGLSLDAASGIMRGTIADPTPRTCETTLIATNALGRAERTFRIVVGDTLALTPPMGWSRPTRWSYPIISRHRRINMW
jgi:alpha-galactosidase